MSQNKDESTETYEFGHDEPAEVMRELITRCFDREEIITMMVGTLTFKKKLEHHLEVCENPTCKVGGPNGFRSIRQTIFKLYHWANPEWKPALDEILKVHGITIEITEVDGEKLKKDAADIVKKTMANAKK